ncbi:MAG: hypothetical protein NPIRA06_00610 [Nitrospirales bacterium]|nr:MAG: hypothetical protein NPIRA06_00610 [Nitrospirales bacterium]
MPFALLNKRRLYKVAILSPQGTYGGWLSDGPLAEQHLSALVQQTLKRGSVVLWRLNPYDKNLLSHSNNLLANRLMPDTTQALRIDRKFDDIFRTWSNGHKRSSNKGEKAGIEVRLASSWNDWLEYFGVYEDSLRRWGDTATSRYPVEFFEAIYNQSITNSAIALWIAILDGRIVAGVLCFSAQRIVNYWHGAVLEAFMSQRPVHLLMREAIRHYCDHTLQWFDFNPSGDLEGIRKFKSSFGTQVLATPNVQFTSKYLTLARKVFKQRLGWRK